MNEYWILDAEFQNGNIPKHSHVGWSLKYKMLEMLYLKGS